MGHAACLVGGLSKLHHVCGTCPVEVKVIFADYNTTDMVVMVKFSFFKFDNCN
jgi:hypothetical protein